MLVQCTTLIFLILFMLRDMNRAAVRTADEAAVLLLDPLYNLDEDQTARIVETMVASGRIAGMKIESPANGIVLDVQKETPTPLVRSQSRDLNYRGLYLGRISLFYSGKALGESIIIMLSATILIIGSLTAANFMITRLLVKRRVNSIFSLLSAGLERIASGNYEHAIELSGYSDIDRIISNVNEMSGKIRQKSVELLVANSSLEQRVALRTSELQKSLQEQRLLQDRLVETSKMGALGQLAAGIAHELNTPLGAIQSSVNIVADYFDTRYVSSLSSFVQFSQLHRDLFFDMLGRGLPAAKNLETPPPARKQIRLLADRLSHEGIQGNVKELAELLLEAGLADNLDAYIPYMRGEVLIPVLREVTEAIIARRMVEVVLESGRKASAVISALRTYLSPGSLEENTLVDISSDIARVLTLMHNSLINGVKIVTDFSPVCVTGSPDKLSQVWMNIIRNALQAMEFKGTLKISTAQVGNEVFVSFTDSGPGIPPDIGNRIFEPFFTTKKESGGMGLGLDICKKIVESHQGSISFRSEPGTTEFLVRLPSTGE